MHQENIQLTAAPPSYDDVSSSARDNGIHYQSAYNPNLQTKINEGNFNLTTDSQTSAYNTGCTVNSPYLSAGEYVSLQPTQPPPSANVPPSYTEVLAAEGTGKFPAIGSRTRSLLNHYQNRSRNENTSSDIESEPETCCDQVSTFMAYVFIFVIFGAIPIAMVVMGAVHIEDCPINPYIPKFMIASGGIAICFCLSLMMFTNNEDEETTYYMLLTGLCIVLVGALFIVNIWGSIIIFQKWNDWNVLKFFPTYGCHNDTYLLGFSLLIIFWLIVPCLLCL